MALGETLGGVRGYPFSRMVGYLPPAGTGRRELGGSQNINNFTSWAFDRQDRCLAGQLLVNRVVINFSQFMVAFSTPDGFHCAYPVIALHRCHDGTVTRPNAGLICGKWLSRVLLHPWRSHRFSYCFFTAFVFFCFLPRFDGCPVSPCTLPIHPDHIHHPANKLVIVSIRWLRQCLAISRQTTVQRRYLRL